MAYLGRKGAPAPLTSADIPDDSITAAKIVDDTIAAGDLANDVVISTSGAITTTGAFTSVGIDDNASGAVAITIDSDEKVGIGTATPGAMLETVNTTGSTSGHHHCATFKNLSTGDMVDTFGGAIQLHLQDTSGTSNAVAAIDWERDNGDDDTGNLQFYTRNDGTWVNGMHIHYDGNVGIGTTSPLHGLHINGKNFAISEAEEIRWLDTSTNARTGRVYSQSGHLYVRSNGGVYITGNEDGNGYYVVFDGGNAYPGSNGTMSWGVSGQMFEDVWAADTSINSSSDERLKENIQPLASCLDKINQLKPCTYDWKTIKIDAVLWTEDDKLPEGVSVGDERFPAKDFSHGTGKTGFIGQELETIFPDDNFVKKNVSKKDIIGSDGTVLIAKDDIEYGLGISGTDMIAFLVKAIQELSTKNDALEAKVTALENA